MRGLDWYCAVFVVLVSTTQVRNPEATEDKYGADMKDRETEETLNNYHMSEEKFKQLLTNYDPNKPPGVESHYPTEVKLGLYVVNVQFLKVDNMEMTIYLRQTWKDQRLQFKGSVNEVHLPSDGSVRIWTPDTHFRNALEVRKHSLPNSNVLIKLKSDGVIWNTQKLSVRSSCMLTDVGSFPMHRKICALMVESFGNAMDIMYYSFMNIPMEINKDLQIDGWMFMDYILYDCSANYTTEVNPSACLEYRLLFTHSAGHHILNVYIPTALLVILSWLPLWMRASHQLTARLVPGLLVELALIYLGSEAYDSLPETSEVTAMHVWMGFSHVFVLLSIIAVIVMDKIFTRQSSTEADTSRISGHADVSGSLRTKVGQRAWIVDLIISVVFIFTYIIFNIVYWRVFSTDTRN